jgi:hypothetical protein
LYKFFDSVGKILAIALLLAATGACASDECTFDEREMLQEVKRVARAYPGATIEARLLSASWATGNGTIESFSVSGCHDYGKTASRKILSKRRRSLDDVIRVALELGEKFMEVDAFDVFSEAVEGDFDIVRESGGNEYVFINYPLGEIALSHSFEDGTDTVVISWSVL